MVEKIATCHYISSEVFFMENENSVKTIVLFNHIKTIKTVLCELEVLYFGHTDYIPITKLIFSRPQSL